MKTAIKESSVIVEYTQREIRFVPKHKSVNKWIFSVKNGSSEEEKDKAFNEAELANAIAKVAKDNSVEINQMQYSFMFILRMLKSTSDWSKKN